MAESKSFEDKINALKQVIEKGVSKTSESFSTLVGNKISMNVSEMNILPIGKLNERIATSSNMVVVVSLPIEKDKKGVMGNLMFVFPMQTSLMFADVLQGKKLGTSKSLNEEDISALKETSNILTGSYLSAISESIGSNLQGIPKLFTCPSSSVADFLFIGAKKQDASALLIETEYKILKLQVTGKFMFLMNLDYLKDLIKKKDIEVKKPEKEANKEEDIVDVLEDVPEGETRVFVLTVEDYSAQLKSLIKLLSEKYAPLCYVTLNKTYDSIERSLKESKVDSSKILFIDAITKTVIADANLPGNCIGISSGSALTELSIAINKALDSGKIKGFLFDSLSTLLVYNHGESVNKFVHNTIAKVKEHKATSVFTIIEGDAKSDMMKEAGMFVDKVVHYK